MDRRTALAAIASLAVVPACNTCSSRSHHAPPGSLASPAWRDLEFPPSPDLPDGQRALVFVPGPPERDRPVLIALHGRGESGRGLAAGARGWRDDYQLERLHEALRAPPLEPDDVGGMTTPARLSAIAASLEHAPYRGPIVVCPYTPDLPDRTARGAASFGAFLTDVLLPRVRVETGAAAERARTGIDGVSMGGRLALLVGLTRPDVFGAVAALQPAIRPDEAESFTGLARAARDRFAVALRLVSSDGDPFLPAVIALSERLRAAGVEHDLLQTPGPHDYAWNRGPGGLEMLLWHDRALRGLPAP